ncbi:GSCOCG00003922001-RA-CDS [Cotesia congregata]|nr:GSCOCG00003922001-RA-CDS [Cotesia congregata]
MGPSTSSSIASNSLSVARRPTESKVWRRSSLPMMPSLSWSIIWKYFFELSDLLLCEQREDTGSSALCTFGATAAGSLGPAGCS